MTHRAHCYSKVIYIKVFVGNFIAEPLFGKNSLLTFRALDNSFLLGHVTEYTPYLGRTRKILIPQRWPEFANERTDEQLTGPSETTLIWSEFRGTLDVNDPLTMDCPASMRAYCLPTQDDEALC